MVRRVAAVRALVMPRSNAERVGAALAGARGHRPARTSRSYVQAAAGARGLVGAMCGAAAVLRAPGPRCG